MKVALVHYRGGLMDGVSLEMEKWKKVLEKMGHEVHIVAGNKAEGVDVYVEELGFDHPSYEILRKNIFEKLEDFSESELIEEIENLTNEFYERFSEVFEDYDLIIPNNIWSLALFFPVGLALERFAKESGKRFIGHHHDFWWERQTLSKATTENLQRILENHFPPEAANIKHVVINSFAKEELFKRRGMQSTIVPNVLDFSRSFTSDHMKEKLREYFGIPGGRIVALQATRITPRKAIELAVELVSKMMEYSKPYVGKKLYDGRVYDGRIILAFSGMCERGAKDYENKIMGLAFDLGVEVLNLYKDVKSGKYSFWDMYSIADFITYPSILEGWGNQLLEAMAAAKPIVLFEYEVFERDIKSSGLEFVSLGSEYNIENGFVRVSHERIDDTAKKMLETLFDPQKYKSVVEKNFEVGRKHFSLERLKKILTDLIRG